MLSFRSQNASGATAVATLTLKDVPDDLYARLKAQAKRHRRSLNAEAITLLERHVPRQDPDEFLRELESFRRTLPKLGFTEEEIRRYITEGRR
jgi:plasmid stability protein